ncbi:MAG: general secretion pathway protein GspK [Candidatus Omnitrophica bacterium]|nr:general secretion pathway protein GspK [Candidatus Omnitrophota bacterium]
MGILRNKKGSIFILSIWALVIFSIYALYLGYSSRMRILFAQRILSRDTLRSVTEAGVFEIIGIIRKEAGTKPELLFPFVLTSFPAHSSGGFGQKTDDTHSEILYNNFVSLPDGKVYYFIEDEESKLNLNTADSSSIAFLIREIAGLDEDEAVRLANDIVDWRDPDDERPDLQIINSEDRYYKLAGLAYGPKNKNFRLIEELLLVKGMTPGAYEAIKPYVTVYGSGTVNINTCKEAVLKSLGLSDVLTEKVLLFRGSSSSKKADINNFFTGASTIIDQLDDYSSLDKMEKDALSELIKNNKIAVDSGVFSAVNIGKLRNGSSRLLIHCIVDENGKMLYWKEDFTN